MTGGDMLETNCEDEDLRRRVRETLERLSRTSSLPTLPSAVTRALAAIRKPEVDLDEICRIVETDVGIAARVLRLANSTIFVRGQRHESLHAAILTIGVSALGEILLSASLGSLYGHDATAQALWDHALATAIACRALAPTWRVRPEQAFMVGLFHDVGRLAFYTTDRSGFETIAALAVSETRRELERQWYGFDHAEAGAVLVGDWGFSDDAVEAIRRHHDPSCGGDAPPLTALLTVADILTRSIAAGGISAPTPEPAVLDAYLSPEDQAAYAERVRQELDEQRKLFA